MDASRRSAWVVAGFAAALDLALVVCAWGFVSLWTDAEVISSAAAGHLVGPAAVAASVAALFLHLGRSLRHPSRMAPATLLAALWSWLALVLGAAVGYAIATGGVIASLVFALGLGVGWFGLLVPALAALVAASAVLTARGMSGGARRPRWPWERDDEE